MEAATFRYFLYGWLGAAVAAFAALLVVPAPYGRYSRPGWGPALNPRLSWLVMELPAVVVPAVLFCTSGRTADLTAAVFLGMWLLHYVQRVFVFPLLLPSASTPMPVAVSSMGFAFNAINGCLQGGWLYWVGPGYAAEWLRDPRFLVGSVLFFSGMAVNWHSDAILRKLRKSGRAGYTLPRGGLFRWVPSPNYLGEIVEWIGWAVATWSLAGASFAFWTAANLIPRAVWHRRWYRRQGLMASSVRRSGS